MRTSSQWLAVETSIESDSYDGTVKRSDAPLVNELNSVADRALAAAPDTAARHLSSPGLRAPILHRAQRDYGSRASQQLVMRALQRQGDSPSPDLESIPSGGGQPLDPSARAPLEQHFHADLGDVRVHTHPEAAESASSFDALAYTAGRDIYFAPGMYAPASRSGQRLLAHEVAHVVQQSSGKQPTIATKSAGGVKIGAPEDMLEMEAERDAEEFMTGEPRTESSGKLSGVPPVRAVQRQTPKAPSTTSLDATAQSTIDAAKDTAVGEDARATTAVSKIIQSYYSGKAANVNSVMYKAAAAGLETDPKATSSNPAKYNIYVGKNFLIGVQDPRSFAHRVLQVGHELEHIDQYGTTGLGPGEPKKDEREFLAFYHEALAAEVPHTGRLQHSMRIDLIDQALGYYNCLAAAPEQDKKDAAKRYTPNQQELLTRRNTEIADMKAKGYTNVPTNPPPAGCLRQP